jgi:membrane protease YdiL (CAAX protease family)
MNPLQPNLPLRLVFPDAMLIGNAIIISSTLLIAPLTEEVIFRGYLFDVLERSFGSYASILATSALFAMAHMVQLDFRFAHVFIIFVLGGIFGVLRYRTGSTAVPILFHALYNLVYILVGFFNYIVLGY